MFGAIGLAHYAETFRAEHRWGGAVGYSFDSVKVFMPAGAKKPIYAPYVKHVPPEPVIPGSPGGPREPTSCSSARSTAARAAWSLADADLRPAALQRLDDRAVLTSPRVTSITVARSRIHPSSVIGLSEMLGVLSCHRHNRDAAPCAARS